MKKEQQVVEGNGNQTAGRDLVHDHSIHVIGNGNQVAGIVGGDLIQVATGGVLQLGHGPAPRIRVVCQPGPQHISMEAKATLKRLVDEIVRAEKAVKREPKGYATVWKALCGKMRCTSYHLIAVERAADAESFLRQWLGRLSSAKSAPVKDPDWRKRKYAYINVNVKQLDAHARLAKLLADDYATHTLAALTDDQLSAVYQVIAAWKRAAQPAPGAA